MADISNYYQVSIRCCGYLKTKRRCPQLAQIRLHSKYRSLKNVWKFKWGHPCPGFISHGWENPSSFTQNGSSLWSHLYNSLLASHVSWDQANRKGNCGMDEEEVEMVAEKELKGKRLSLWLWGSVRNGGKRSPMGNESPFFNSINVSLSNERKRNVVIGWPGDWQKPSAGFQDMLQICCYNVPPARGCVDPFVRIFRIISGLFPQLGIISVTKVR